MAAASRRCMIYKCGKTSRDRNLSFHSFPKRKDIRDQWIINIKLGQPDWVIPRCSSSKYYAICSRHFEPNCFRTVKHKFDLASRNTLKYDAVPTLYMSGSSDPALLPKPTNICNGTEFKNHTSDNEEVAKKFIKENGTEQNNEGSARKQLKHRLSHVADSFPASTSTPTQINSDERIPKKYALASRRCMVYGCGSTSRNRNLSFHAFPKKTELREAWITRMKANRPDGSPNWPESNYYAVCSKHFTSDCFKTMKHNFSSTSRNTLRPDAVPNLFLEGSQNSEQSFQQELYSVNGNDVLNSFQGNSNYANYFQGEEKLWMSQSLNGVAYENDEGWSPMDCPFVDASTQTVERTFFNGNVEMKQTRTVRVQTMITIKKTLQDQSTQYDLPALSSDETPHGVDRTSKLCDVHLNMLIPHERIDTSV